MKISLKIKDGFGNEEIKSLESITTDEEESKRQFLFEEEGDNISVCIGKAMGQYRTVTDFVQNVNYYRAYLPNSKYAKTYPMKVRFYK